MADTKKGLKETLNNPVLKKAGKAALIAFLTALLQGLATGNE